MQQLIPVDATSALSIAAAAAALALPPGAFGVVPPWWSSAESGVVPEVELEIWAPAGVASNLTNMVLYAGALHPLVYADQVVTFAGATDKLTKAAHGLLTGDGPLFLTTAGGAPPPELVDGTGYYVIKSDANTFYLAATRELALAGTAIALSTDGTGGTTISDSADTQRMFWHTHDGLLGLAGDGAIVLTGQVAYRKRVPHSPRAIAYALVGTLSAGTVSAQLIPIMSRL